MKKLLECVPNFSEGRDLTIIKTITDTIESVEGIKLLNVDRGHGANRTVVTFIGESDQVVEAAFLAIKRAAELIDMRFHTGEHPRMGATDVCPLIPISNITMEETVELAQRLASRVGAELSIPVYCYEYAAFTERRRSLAHCRSGEYEGLPEKMRLAEWRPDFGPLNFNMRSGATAIGARKILIAYNVNLNTSSVEVAKSIAAAIRENGKVKREKDPVNGKIIRDVNGNPERIPGSLRKVRAIGWHIKEYGIAQVSMNLTDMNITPIHRAFEEVCDKALGHGVKVTGSELIGLIPLQAMLEAGRYFLRKGHHSIQIPETEIIHAAVKYLGLDELAPFDPHKKIIEYLLEERK
jgi:glutamate formiminotransferase / formiminotetrahydrofolate cyclodeaminase